MKTFHDNTGRGWAVNINVDCIKRVRALLDINLLDAVNGKLLEQLVSDPILLCDCLYAVCKPEADEKQISDEDFGRAMAGDAIDNATTALLEELVDFFPKGKREVLARALAKLKMFEEKTYQAAHRRIENPALERKLEEFLAKEIELPELTPGG